VSRLAEQEHRRWSLLKLWCRKIRGSENVVIVVTVQHELSLFPTDLFHSFACSPLDHVFGTTCKCLYAMAGATAVAVEP
jgi:hypothetical protein